MGALFALGYKISDKLKEHLGRSRSSPTRASGCCLGPAPLRVEEPFPVWVVGCAVYAELGDNALQLVSGFAFIAFLEDSQQPPLLARTLVFPAIGANLS